MAENTNIQLLENFSSNKETDLIKEARAQMFESELQKASENINMEIRQKSKELVQEIVNRSLSQGHSIGRGGVDDGFDLNKEHSYSRCYVKFFVKYSRN